MKGCSGRGELPVTWDDILWSAVTIGRPKSYCMFEHGESAIYEAIFRWSLVNMALENSEFAYPARINLTSSAKSLDPTEKGMVNYFLGMIFCKLFASKLLGVPWLLHLDVCRPQYDLELSGRSRPDLIGNDRAGQWYGFECKGRINRPNRNVINKAKEQARRIVSVNDISCSLHVAAITYFVNDVINFYWCDPPPSEDGEDQIKLSLPNNVWQNYYGRIAELISEREERTTPGDIRQRRDGAGHLSVLVEQCDVEVKVHRLIEERLVERDWEGSRLAAIAATERLAKEGFHADGLRVRAGRTWYQSGGEERSTPRQE